MEFDYTQTNKQVQVMALRLERGGELVHSPGLRRCGLGDMPPEQHEDHHMLRKMPIYSSATAPKN